jgi:hypothetical protein
VASVVVDLVVMLVVFGFAGLALLGVVVARELLPVRPSLPEDDCPPPGLSRLVPVGRQLDQECRRGVVALEQWLARTART